jgi:hypothetical protein
MKIAAADTPLDPAVVRTADPDHHSVVLEDRFGLPINR